MPSYFVEIYAPGESDVADLAARARTAAGDDVRYIRSVFVPEDETCFHLFEGPSAEAVKELSERFKASQAAMLAEIGFSSAQGFLIAEPMPAQQLSEWRAARV